MSKNFYDYNILHMNLDDLRLKVAELDARFMSLLDFLHEMGILTYENFSKAVMKDEKVSKN